MNADKKDIKVVSPRLLLFLIVICTLAVSVSIYYEYRAQQRDHLILLQRQATIVNSILSISTQNAITVADNIAGQINSQILTNLRIIESLDSYRQLFRNQLDTLLQISDYETLLMFDAQGNLDLQALKETSPADSIPSSLLHYRLNIASNDTIVTLYDFQNPENERLAAFVRRKNGGLIVATISNEDIRSMRNTIGIGYLLMHFRSEENIEYIVIQNRETIVAGSFDGYTLSTFSGDQVLRDVLNDNEMQSRISHHDGHLVFEAISPFTLNGQLYGVLRLGLSMQEYERLKSDMRKRLYLFGAVIVVVGLLFGNFLISYRQRKLLQYDLERLRYYTNEILENLVSGVISLDQQGKIQSVNKQAEVLLNMEYHKLIHQNFTSLPVPLHERIEQCLLAKPAIPSVTQHWIRGRGNRERLISLLANFMEDENNNTICVLLINDITDQTLLEEQIRRNQRLTALQNMASSVAHEIKNPLNSIQLIVDLIRKKFKPVEGADIYSQQLDTVRGEINRISTIVEQYLRFTRPPRLSLMPVTIPGIVDEAAFLFETDLKKKQIVLNRQLDVHQPVKGDRDQLKQVFINIIKNAQEAIEGAGEISITGKDIGSYYEVRVQDNGKGISKKELASIFDFHYTTKKDGSGIGLSVVQQIMTAHDSMVTVESREGQGTTILLTFPLVAENINEK